MKILIDNGHGENTTGKRSPDGKFREYSYAREIAKSIEGELKFLGIDAERIVTESEDIPLEERVRRVNEICGRFGAENVVLVSIHCNASKNGEWGKARGWSAYTSKGKTKSDELATMLYAEAEKNFAGLTIRKDLSDGDPDWEEAFYILRVVGVPIQAKAKPRAMNLPPCCMPKRKRILPDLQSVRIYRTVTLTGKKLSISCAKQNALQSLRKTFSWTMSRM